MAINFPNSPTAFEIFISNGRRYVWDTEKWTGGTPTTQVTIASATPPSLATTSINDLWWNTTDGGLYVFYNDGNSSQWVSAAPPGINGTNSVVSVNSPLTYDSVSKIIGLNSTVVMNGGTVPVGFGGVASATAEVTITEVGLANSGSLAGRALDIAQNWATTGNPTTINSLSYGPSGASSKLIDLQYAQAVIIGSISATTLTVTQIISGIIVTNVSIFGAGIAPGTVLTAGAGNSWTISGTNQNVSSTLIYFTPQSLSKFSVSKTGAITCGQTYMTDNHTFYGGGVKFIGDGNARFNWDGKNLIINQDGFFGIGRYNHVDAAAADVKLYRDPVQGASAFGTLGGVLAIRDGVNSQAQRWYNTHTDASNFERVSVSFNRPTTAVFTGTISNGAVASGTIVNVTAITSGVIATGMVLTGTGVSGTITGFVPSSTFTGSISGTTLTSGTVTEGAVTIGQIISGTGVTAGTIIVSNSGSNSWVVSASQIVTSTTISGVGGTGAIGTYITNTALNLTSTTITGNRVLTAPYAVIAAESGGTGADNIGIALSPKGTGAITAQVPDGTITGGTTRGANSIDLQTFRDNADRVASGQYATAIGGNNKASLYGNVAIGSGNAATGTSGCVAIGINNTAGGEYSVALGASCSAGGTGAVSLGMNSTASAFSSTTFGQYTTANKNNQVAFGLSSAGNQLSFLGLLGTTNNATPLELLCGGAANARATIPNNTTWAADIDIVARSAGGTENAYFKRRLLIKKVTAVDSTALVGSIESVSTITSTGASTWVVTLSADTTNGALKIEVTGAASTTIRWVAKVSLVEVLQA